MIRKALDLIREEFRPRASYNAVAEVASYHRIQCSPGFRDAARFIQESLFADGIQSRILQFPAKRGESWWSQDSFCEWEGKDAELVLLENGKRVRLCSFAEHPISLVQRSAPTPEGGISTTMVYIERPMEDSSYEEIDVAGKLVFTRGPVASVAAVAVDKHGALGIVVDNMAESPPVRDRFTLPDGRQYQSFWPADPGKHKAFGFLVTPRQGDYLRGLFASGKTQLEVYARVDSRFFDGTMEVVEASIPGETEEEVIAIAHLCHPQPSANDNASGCGALLEGVRTLHRLVESGRLPRPKRSIRFVWPAEMTGSYAYLASREEAIPNMVAAINLDMVGQNQDLCGSTFTVVRPVAALPGFGGELAEAILKLMTKEVPNLGRSHLYASFRWTVSPYSGGSDHYIWGDPSVGVTCPMLIQWPDRFYHTSEDTIDKVDPASLALSGVLAATYLYVAACATTADGVYLAGEMGTGFPDEVENTLALWISSWRTQLEAASPEQKEEVLARGRRTLEKRIAFMADRKVGNIESLVKLCGESSALSQAAVLACKSVRDTERFMVNKHLLTMASLAQLGAVQDLPPAKPDDDEGAKELARKIVPVRRYRGPFSNMAKEVSPEVQEAQKAFREKYPRMMPPGSQLEYWADGKRTLLEIADLIEGETGFSNLTALLDYYDLAVKRGVFLGSDG